ncbi:MAG TPA: methyl-accepting chemotaxis protein, partial [Spirochaetia bacterium]|nr:methyl-accepting chemotaxis protein [Spirochaetia bacterium]
IKVQIATFTIILLFAVISVAAIALRTVLTAQVGTTVAATEAALQINGFGNLVTQYMAGTRSFAALQQDYDAYQNTMKSRYSGVTSQKVSIQSAGNKTTASLGEHVVKLWQEIGQAEALTQENQKIEADVIALGNESIGKSNEFLGAISDRLSDPAQQKKVTVLERKVIRGASANTNNGFTIQLLFKDMKLNLGNKDTLFQYLDAAEKNAVADGQRLAGTDFAQLPKESEAAIVTTHELAARYVQNETSREEIAAQVAGDLSSLVSALNGNLVQDTRVSFARITNVINTAVILFAIVAALVVALQMLISRSITRPLTRGVAFAQRVAGGDFTQQLDIVQKDETGMLAKALNEMSMKLKDMVAIVQENAEQIASSSEQLSASAQKLAEGSQIQASNLEETSASVEELTSSVDQVAAHAQSQTSAVERGTFSMVQVQKSIE